MPSFRPPRPWLSIIILAALFGAAVGTSAAMLGFGPARNPPRTVPTAPATTAPPEDFWTVVVASIPRSSPDAEAAAEQVLQELRDAGFEAAVLDSSDYASLQPGFLVVYSGHFPDQAGAEERLAALRDVGTAADAYIREARRN